MIFILNLCLFKQYPLADIEEEEVLMETKSIDSQNINVRQKLNFVDDSFEDDNASQNSSNFHETKNKRIKTGGFKEVDDKTSHCGSCSDQNQHGENTPISPGSCKIQSGMLYKQKKCVLIVWI